MALYDGVSGVAREVSKKYDGVSAVAREVYVAYDGVSGVAREYFKSGTPISNLAVGKSVYIKVNGVSKEFLVVHQGRPSTAYDSSCDGTWLLMKDIYTSRAWDSTNNDYANSDIRTYLNGTFLNLFDAGIKSAIKQVKLPYTKGVGNNGALITGSSGLAAKVFLLSYTELGYYSAETYANAEGAVLSYFNGVSDSKRIAYYNGTATAWWLRSPNLAGDSNVWNALDYGGSNRGNLCSYSRGVRPALVLPSSATFDENYNVS